jgi:hypothetical protein
LFFSHSESLSMDAAGAASSTAQQQQDGRSVGGGGVSDYLNLGMFNSSTIGQQHSGGEQLLVGGGSATVGDFGNALGNGFMSGNVVDSSNNNAPTSASTGTSFDLSDFPTLGGTGGGGGPVTASAPGSGNGLAAALRQQQQLIAQQHMLQGSVVSQQKGSNMYRLAMTGSNGTFNVTPEDFPALSGGAPQSSVGGSVGVNGSTLSASALLQGGSSVQQSVSQRAPSNGSGGAGGLYGGGGDLEGGATNQLDGRGGLLGSSGIGGLEGLGGLQQQQQSSGNPGPILSRAPSSSGGPPSGAPSAVGSATAAGGAGSGASAGTALGGDYGLLGLLGVIRMTDADRNALALGSDLTMLGLNLGTVEQLYSTFSGPWSDGLQPKEPHYQVGHC